MTDHNTLISLRHVSKTYDDREILTNVDLDINRGDFIAITGPNGGGKTTLLRIILRLLKPTSGSVEYCDTDGGDGMLRIGYLPQKNMIDSRFPVTVGEVLRMGLMGLKDIDRRECDRLVVSTATLVGMESYLDASIGRLSGGQLQRTLLGRAIISSPQVLVLDEPLSYVDKPFEARIYDIVEKMSHSTTILLVSHEMTQIASMANRHIIVNRTLHFCSSASHFVHYDCCED